MSVQLALAAISGMNMRAAFVAPISVTNVAASLKQLSMSADMDDDEQFAAEFRQRKELLATYGFQSETPMEKPFAFAEGLAFIPVHGSLINRFSYSLGYVTGYNFLRAQAAAADADPDVKGIVFDINSYGGEAAGCFELVADLKAIEKPTLAVVDSAAYSAAYAVASAADEIIVTPSGGAGSIGVIAMHISLEKMLDKFGVDVTMIYAGSHKADGNPFQALPENVRNNIQDDINKSYKKFTTLVAENRGMDVQAVIDTQAQTYRAEDAMELGLIDAVATPAQAVSAFFNELSSSPTSMETSMTTTSQAQTLPGAESATAQTDEQQLANARQAERERMNGIMTCEEAAGRSQLANHLALNTELSVDAAKAILKAAPAEQQAAKGNAFEAAMGSTANPDVGSDVGTSQTELSKGKQILADYAAATGVTLQ